MRILTASAAFCRGQPFRAHYRHFYHQRTNLGQIYFDFYLLQEPAPFPVPSFDLSRQPPQCKPVDWDTVEQLSDHRALVAAVELPSPFALAFVPMMAVLPFESRWRFSNCFWYLTSLLPWFIVYLILHPASSRALLWHPWLAEWWRGFGRTWVFRQKTEGDLSLAIWFTPRAFTGQHPLSKSFSTTWIADLCFHQCHWNERVLVPFAGEVCLFPQAPSIDLFRVFLTAFFFDTFFVIVIYLANCRCSELSHSGRPPLVIDAGAHNGWCSCSAFLVVFSNVLYLYQLFHIACNVFGLPCACIRASIAASACFEAISVFQQFWHKQAFNTDSVCTLWCAKRFFQNDHHNWGEKSLIGSNSDACGIDQRNNSIGPSSPSEGGT